MLKSCSVYLESYKHGAHRNAGPHLDLLSAANVRAMARATNPYANRMTIFDSLKYFVHFKTHTVDLRNATELSQLLIDDNFAENLMPRILYSERIWSNSWICIIFSHRIPFPCEKNLQDEFSWSKYLDFYSPHALRTSWIIVFYQVFETLPAHSFEFLNKLLKAHRYIQEAVVSDIEVCVVQLFETFRTFFFSEEVQFSSQSSQQHRQPRLVWYPPSRGRE